MATNADDPIAPFRWSGGFARVHPGVQHQPPAGDQPAHALDAADGRRTRGLPVGVQLVADSAREDVLIRVAAQLEAAAPWAHRTPDLSLL